MFSTGQLRLASGILARCAAANLRLATAKSCTGGLLSACLTEIAGASAVFDRGFIVYDNRAKADLLGVSDDCLARFGAVSEETARAMAQGVIGRAAVDLGIAITGIAGPGGGTVDKPVGLVWFALARRGRPTRAAHAIFAGDRHAVRMAALERALALLDAALGSPTAESASE